MFDGCCKCRASPEGGYQRSLNPLSGFEGPIEAGKKRGKEKKRVKRKGRKGTEGTPPAPLSPRNNFLVTALRVCDYVNFGSRQWDDARLRRLSDLCWEVHPSPLPTLDTCRQLAARGRAASWLLPLRTVDQCRTYQRTCQHRSHPSSPAAGVLGLDLDSERQPAEDQPARMWSRRFDPHRRPWRSPMISTAALSLV